MTDVSVVFGLGPAGLFLSRILSRAGRTVVGVARPDDIGRYSNCIDKLIISTEADEILFSLGELALRFPGKMEGQTASDQYLTLILDRRSEFERVLSFGSPDLDMLEMLNDKGTAYSLLKQTGIPSPAKTYLDTVDSCDCVGYPVVIKPRAKHLGKTSGVVEKVAVIKNEAELKEIVAELERIGENPSDFTCEEMIPGDNFFEIGYGGYAEKGHMKVDIVVRQIKQYPQGVACAAVEVADGETAEKVRSCVAPLLLELGYTGFIQFDIKERPETGELYVLDVNPRVWGSVGILARKFEHLDRLFGNGDEPPLKRDELIYWHSPLKELLAKNGSNPVRLPPPRNTNATRECSICMTGEIRLRSSASSKSERGSWRSGEERAGSREKQNSKTHRRLEAA